MPSRNEVRLELPISTKDVFTKSISTLKYRIYNMYIYLANAIKQLGRAKFLYVLKCADPRKITTYTLPPTKEKVSAVAIALHEIMVATKPTVQCACPPNRIGHPCAIPITQQQDECLDQLNQSKRNKYFELKSAHYVKRIVNTSILHTTGNIGK